jgi:hypothetical protein
MSITYFVSETTTENNSVICVKHNEGQFGENERDSAANTLFRCQLAHVLDWKLHPQQYWRCLTVHANWSLSSKSWSIHWPKPLRTSLPFTDRCLLASTHNLVPVLLKISGCHGQGRQTGLPEIVFFHTEEENAHHWWQKAKCTFVIYFMMTLNEHGFNFCTQNAKWKIRLFSLIGGGGGGGER